MNMQKMMMTVALGAAMVFLGAPTASAQTTCPPHATLGFAMNGCDASGHIACTELCACDRGYHPRDADQPVGADNPCMRNAPQWGTYHEPLCAFGAVRTSRNRCDCPESLGARRVLSAVNSVSREFAQSLVEQGQLEDRVGRGRTVFVRACYNPLASQGAPGSVSRQLSEAYAEGLRIICGAPEAATDEQLVAACRDTRTLIESIRNLRPGNVSITFPDPATGEPREWTVQEFVDGVLVTKFGEIGNRLSELESWRRDVVDPTLGDHGARITALEQIFRATHFRLGGFGRLGFSTAGPATGAGGASAELLFRFGDLPVGAYGRLEFGGQETGWDVGGSLYLSGGAGLTYFTGGRRDTTVSLGLFAEDLLEPFADDPNGIGGSEIGVALGAELSASMPLPGDAYWVRIRVGVSISYSDRYRLDQGAFSALTGAYIAPTIGLEFQP